MLSNKKGFVLLRSLSRGKTIPQKRNTFDFGEQSSIHRPAQYAARPTKHSASGMTRTPSGSPPSSAASASRCRTGWIGTIRPGKRLSTSFPPRPPGTTSGSAYAFSRSAPRTTTPDERIHREGGIPSPSTTTPAAGGSCWKSWICLSTTTAARRPAPRS